MPNPDFNEDFNNRRKSISAQKGKRADNKTEFTEKNVSWPDVPGKTQTKNRSGGTKKLKIHPVSKGL